MAALNPQEPVTRAIEFAKVTEELGFDGFWLWDTWIAKDSYIGLTLAAMHTKNIFLAPGVAPSPLRHPALLLNTVATLDDISGGRAILGLGSGGQATAGRLGIRKARMDQFRHDLQLLKTIIQDGEYTENSTQYRVESVNRAIPIHVAAWGPRMLEVSGALADGVIIMGPEQKSVMADKIQKIRKAANIAGRDPKEVKIILHATCEYNEDPTFISDRSKTLVIHHLQRTGYESEYPEKYSEVFRKVRQEVSKIALPVGPTLGTELVPDELVKYSLVIGTEEECLIRLKDLLTLKPDEIVFSIGWGNINKIEKLASLVSKI
jgi:5,10-methylenetetrahydromethanopterin reductase